MTRIYWTYIFLILTIIMSAQAVEESIQKIYYSDSDTIRYKYSHYPDVFELDLSVKDTVSPGTNAVKGVTMTAFIGSDTLNIDSDNFPFGRRSYVNIQTPKGRKVIIFRYNAVASSFSQDYINKNEGRISFEIPEVYELANIIWNLSPAGLNATDLQTDTEYYKAVLEYFKPYSGHPVFQKLTVDGPNAAKYYEFRENSFMYYFDVETIVKSDNYHYVYGNDWENFSNLFTELLPLVQDFSDKSNFRVFYFNNKKFYRRNIQRVEQLLPIRNMWTWLEKEFPKKFNAYKIIVSPLIGGSHSTQNYYSKNTQQDSWFGETVMFICDTYRFDRRKELSELEKQGLMSGIVFTEIDHNYVNPVSLNYRKEIDEIFNRSIWFDNRTTHYDNPQSIFNEYMTHAVFCLWVRDNYDPQTADFVINDRVKLNIGKRGFIKFKEFYDTLRQLRSGNQDFTVAELYPQIIEWAKKQK